MADEKRLTREEILEALRQTPEPESPAEESWRHGPMSAPVMDRWRHLPEWKRRWFEEQSLETLELVTRAAKMMRRMEEWGTVTKWLILTIIAIAVGISQFGDAILKMFGWFSRSN